jgi:hypothetical protein
VRVYDAGWTLIKTANSNYLTGAYTISGLAAGNYYVATSQSANYIDEYYNNATTRSAASAVSVAADQTTPGINFALSIGGTISGTVLREPEGTGIYGVAIYVYDTNWVQIKTSSTDASGSYSIAGLPSGSYYVTSRVQAYIDEYYSNTTTPESAQLVAVTQGVTSANINFSLAPGYGITGTVVSKLDNGGIAGAHVQVYDDEWELLTEVTCDSSGNYRLDGFPAGTYYLRTNNTAGYIDEYYHDAYTQGTASPIHVYDDPGVAEWSYRFVLVPTVPAAVDFDKDSHSDISVWRPDSGVWYTLPSGSTGTYTGTQWGYPGDKVVSGDYDGDRKTDLAVWRPSNGVWFILPSGSPGSYTSLLWGLNADTPVPGDYDGDGKTDVAVWRPESGVWFIVPSSVPGSYSAINWGMPGDVPVARDYDGDGKTDIAVYRKDTGIWYTLPSASPGTYVAVHWGLSTDKPVPGDYDKDGKADVAVWRPSDGVWYILPSNSPGTYRTYAWGMLNDIPAPNDFDGDGQFDVAVWRPANGVWYVLKSATPGSYSATYWGASGDTPISSVTDILYSVP